MGHLRKRGKETGNLNQSLSSAVLGLAGAIL